MRKSQASTRMLEVREAGRLDPKEWSDRAIGRHVGAHNSTVSNIRQAIALRVLLRERGLDADAIDDSKLYRIATLGAGTDDLARGSVRLSVGTGQDMDTSWTT